MLFTEMSAVCCERCETEYIHCVARRRSSEKLQSMVDIVTSGLEMVNKETAKIFGTES
jgi:hypothetical protein